jgi:hypothetical protein
MGRTNGCMGNWKIPLGIAAAGLLLLGGAAFILYPEVLKSPPAAAYRTPANAAEANLQDIDYLEQIVALDRSFSPDAMAAFSTGVAELKSRAASLSPAQLEMEASRLMALADNGHTCVRGVSNGVSLNSLPIRIYRFEEGYFVVKARPELADLLGARVTAINGRTPDALVEALRPFVGGPPSLQREYATYMLISPQSLNQEVRDYEGDLLNGIRTSAVVFGCRRTFLASLLTFTAAYGMLAGLAALGILPRLLLWSTILWPLHVAWSLRALQRGLGFETALWMQRRYRLLFAFIGLAMLAR